VKHGRIVGAFVLVCLGAAVLGAAIWAAVRAGREPPLPAVLRVGIDPAYPPFAYPCEAGYCGLDVMLAERVAARLGVSITWVPLGYDGLYDALVADRVDLVAAALVHDPAREADVRFTIPYFNAGLVLVAPPGGPVSAMRAMAGHRLAVAYGADAHGEATRWSRRVGAFTLLAYENARTTLDAVRVGAADAALVEHIEALLNTDRTTVVTEIVTVRPLVMAVSRRSPRLAAAVDGALRDLSASGQLDAVIAAALATR
jgi:polar amino acid transport system substrate-binding protein